MGYKRNTGKQNLEVETTLGKLGVFGIKLKFEFSIRILVVRFSIIHLSGIKLYICFSVNTTLTNTLISHTYLWRASFLEALLFPGGSQEPAEDIIINGIMRDH